MNPIFLTRLPFASRKLDTFWKIIQMIFIFTNPFKNYFLKDQLFEPFLPLISSENDSILRQRFKRNFTIFFCAPFHILRILLLEIFLVPDDYLPFRKRTSFSIISNSFLAREFLHLVSPEKIHFYSWLSSVVAIACLINHSLMFRIWGSISHTTSSL